MAKQEGQTKPIATNKQARRNYEIVETCEANCLELEDARVGVHEHARGEEVRYEEF